jgi:hypothetical protein
MCIQGHPGKILELKLFIFTEISGAWSSFGCAKMVHARRCTKESNLCSWYREFKEMLASFIEHRFHIKFHNKRFTNNSNKEFSLHVRKNILWWEGYIVYRK